MCYEKAVEIIPISALAYIKQGNALSYLNRLEEAIQSYHQALQIDLDNVEASINKGIVETNQ